MKFEELPQRTQDSVCWWEGLGLHPLPFGYLLPLGPGKGLHFFKGVIGHVLFQFTKLNFPAATKTSCNLSAGEKLHTGRRLPEILISLRSLL